ncbi:MAG: phosphoenolpyruvate carboxylase [Parvularcula sp.]
MPSAALIAGSGKGTTMASNQETAMDDTPLTEASALAFLRQAELKIKDDPQTNSVFALALCYFRKLQTGDCGIESLADLAGEVGDDLLKSRVDFFRTQHFPDGPPYPELLESRLDEIAARGFAPFKNEIEKPKGGLVLTGHPTFALSKAQRDAFCEEVTHPTPQAEKALFDRSWESAAMWAQSISLLGEHDEAQQALSFTQDAMVGYAHRALGVARQAFPDQWRTIRPALPTIASWVGYDLDGRTDIQWTDSLSFRLKEKSQQLTNYVTRLRNIVAQHGDNDKIRGLIARLSNAQRLVEEQYTALSVAGDSPEKIVAAANLITAVHPAQMTSADEIQDTLNALIEDRETDDDLATALIELSCLIEACQLGTARIHLRLNASQMNSVIRRELGVRTDTANIGRVTASSLAALAAEAEDEGPRCASFADLYFEQTVAQRQFMMCSIILAYIDRGAPIRFLIAESESPATVLSALFLAKRYGVADKLDISPLFETPHALLTGARFIERLLKEDVFQDYVRERGYLSIQLGFSDAGRFVGQVAANMAIERLHNLIGRLLSRQIPGADLLIFNTHGESIGRGAYPGSFEDRLDHALTPWTRAQNAKRHLNIRHEVSFQGGDGYLHFGNAALAEATYFAFCLNLLSPADDAALDDPFYQETDFVWDTYRAIKSWHETLFNRPEYEALLSDFATSFLVRAGSRARRRTDARGPRALRAISHNATLQQLGVPLNSAAGIGSAMPLETDRLVSLINRSPRMRHLINLALTARLRTSVPSLRGYATVYSPYLWTGLAHQATGPKRDEYIRIHTSLDSSETFPQIMRIADSLAIDLLSFDDLLAQLKDAPSVRERHEQRRPLHILHAIRQALMMQALSLTANLPQFSDRHGIDVQEIIHLIHTMQIDEAIAGLREIFPASRDPENAFDALDEKSSADCVQSKYGYDEIHADVIGPLNLISETTRAITLAISHAYNAYG